LQLSAGKEVVRVAWMRMMGADSVDYHERTVAGRGDDPVTASGEYYSSRGETPMSWGGSGCGLLGVAGEVDLADYRAVFGIGGAHDPRTGRRLVGCLRPGLELVISPHKSVAELGVIGRAEDMHEIVDAERDATLEYLNRLVSGRGGRRGRAQIRVATGGLIWATSRHATTRAGDPQVHDHVLIANAVFMYDARGGWKGADTAFLRDHLHAATAVGRMAAAAKAVELGYGIVADPGPSGRLGGWAIAGIPAEVCELHSTRSAQITAAVGPGASYAARSVAARATRDRKAEVPVEDLLTRWQDELSAAGHPPADLLAAVEAAGSSYQLPVADLEQLAGELLGPDGRLSSEKTFTRGDVIIAAAPHLHGLPVSVLDQVVEAVLANDDAVALPIVTGSREPVWTARCVLADEERIATVAEALTGDDGPKVEEQAAADAVTCIEERLGVPLTATQHEVAIGLLTSGYRLDLVKGVAGSGKTTTLAAVREGFESAGHTVLGTATSGQAARNLGDGAGIESRTVASLAWRLEHNTLELSDRHVLILDEGAMTSDVDFARLLTAVERSGAKLIVVGDDRQLGAIGPGGALTALAERHPEQLWALTDNLRQNDPAEAVALRELRDGDIAAAVAWYARNGRVHAVPDRRRAVTRMIRTWASDIDAGREPILLAYRRDNVESLNNVARDLWERSGRLTGPELTAPGGRTYRSGDQVITLAPGPKGAWVTSQAARVTAVDPEAQTLTAITPDGRQLQMGAEDIGADRLAHGYAITAHRAQGTTVEVAHVLDDGGGRELAYVAMSRARNASHVYTTAPDLAQAAQRLTWSWDDERRQQWATDQARAAERLAELRAEHRELLASIPPGVTDQLAHVHEQQAALETDLADLRTGAGRWANTPVRASYEHLQVARRVHEENLRRAQDPRRGLLGRHRSRGHLKTSAATLQVAERAWQRTTEPHARLLEGERSRLAAQVGELEAAQQARADFIKAHPEVIDRVNQLRRAIEAQQGSPHRPRPLVRNAPTPPPIIQRRSLASSYELPPTTAVPRGPEL
jgi:conjugative relaxase-like TrwC/TraI family protein